MDEIKRERYGTTERCIPDKDFPEAGRRASQALDGADRVVVVEAFADEKHIELVRRQLPKDAREEHFLFWCEPSIGEGRKRGEIDPSMVSSQFQRFAACTYQNRTRIDTSNRTAADVAAEIASNL